MVILKYGEKIEKFMLITNDDIIINIPKYHKVYPIILIPLNLTKNGHT